MTNKTTSAIDLVTFLRGFSPNAPREGERERIVEADTIARLQAALTPSAETKAAYIGDFKFVHVVDGYDEDGEPRSEPLTISVPWTTIKEIMAAIREHASSVGGE